ncbi:MAG: glycosyltransferase [Pseudomonadota bacterium]
MEKRIHQMWKDEDVPTDYGDPESWKKHNPDWEYIFWTDDTMLEFMEAEFPELLWLYNTYPKPVQRADLFRYLAVYKMGGLYADIDTDCLRPLSLFENEKRLVVCEEPTLHSKHEKPRGFIPLQLNATFASPAGHPFWPHLIHKIQRVSQRVKDAYILDCSGPCFLAGCLEDFPQQDLISYNSSHLFNPMTSNGEWEREDPFGDYGHTSVCVHNWQGSWFRGFRFQPVKQTHNVFWSARAEFQREKEVPPALRFRTLDTSFLLKDVQEKPEEPQIAIMVPIRDSEKYFAKHKKLLSNLTYPKDKMRLVYIEGGSKDGTLSELETFKTENPFGFKEIQIISDGPYFSIPPFADKRHINFQLKRRSALAQARNLGVKDGLKDADDWVLWLNADVKETPTDIVQTLISQNAKVVAPNGVEEYGERSKDPRAFFTIGGDRAHLVARQLHRRIYQAPSEARRRLYLCDLNYLSKANLSSVGTNMFIVDADIHRAGLTFPDTPYKHLIEVEGFSLWAKDMAIDLVGLPNEEILLQDWN